MMKTIQTPRGPYRYKPVYLYVGRKVIDRDVATENLRDLVPVLETAGIRFGPIFGSLLGMVREHDFIAWDEDIDLYILKEEEERFKDALWALRGKGFELVRYDKRGLYSVMRRNEYIDFYVLRPVSGELRHTGGADFIFERYLQDTMPYDFKGITLQIPRDYEEYLTFTYGDWRTPRQEANYHQGKLRILLGRIRNGMKDLIPGCLYPVMVRMHRKKDLEKFLRKCREKGVPVHEKVRL